MRSELTDAVTSMLSCTTKGVSQTCSTTGVMHAVSRLAVFDVLYWRLNDVRQRNVLDISERSRFNRAHFITNQRTKSTRMLAEFYEQMDNIKGQVSFSSANVIQYKPFIYIYILTFSRFFQ
jgi:hypothetical protein